MTELSAPSTSKRTVSVIGSIPSRKFKGNVSPLRGVSGMGGSATNFDNEKEASPAFGFHDSGANEARPVK
jgi:hypothetical protein